MVVQLNHEFLLKLILIFRFCCASADNQRKLEFHGERRVWDGRTIRRKSKGNSALYILIEQEVCSCTITVARWIGGSGIALIQCSFSKRIDTCTLMYSSPIVFLNKLPILQIVQCNLSFASLLLIGSKYYFM